MLLVYMRNFVCCTFSFMLSCDYWWLHCHQRRVFMTCCIGWVLHLRGSIHFFALVHAFLCSMLSEGVLVFRGSELLSCICLGGACEFCALFCCFIDYVFLSRLCWAVAHIFGDRDLSKSIWRLWYLLYKWLWYWLLCGFCSHIYEFYLALDHMDDILDICFSNHFFCFNVVNTVIKGEIVQIKLIWALIW